MYVRHLSRGLAELGQHVEVFSGPPYPELLDPRVALRKVPSLDLYREPDPFLVPRPSEIHDRIDLLELATMWTVGFPEPRTFGLRAARILLQRRLMLLGPVVVVDSEQRAAVRCAAAPNNTVDLPQ